jgi:phage terminase small subunit
MSKERKLNPKQEKFAQEVVLNGGDKVKARAAAGYSTKMSNPSQGVDADKLYNHAKISLRIAELQIEADKIAKESFTISVGQRLRWLNEITLAGLSTYVDQGGNKRRENLTASTGAIKTMNEMIGTSKDDDDQAPSLEITFQVKQPVKEVKITNAKP